jgi:NAD(P)-dependent dehydrogenase (short-subunit alcohol dehydrogenase family)
MFDATSTTDDVLTGVDLRGKRILVTGVSSGIGVETARSLSAHGAWVVGAVPDIAKAEAVVAPIRCGWRGGPFSLSRRDLIRLGD